ncbi:hypothetical protein IWX48DRAFT_334052 [Phyllosticta citricarpa]
MAEFGPALLTLPPVFNYLMLILSMCKLRKSRHNLPACKHNLPSVLRSFTQKLLTLKTGGRVGSFPLVSLCRLSRAPSPQPHLNHHHETPHPPLKTLKPPAIVHVPVLLQGPNSQPASQADGGRGGGGQTRQGTPVPAHPITQAGRARKQATDASIFRKKRPGLGWAGLGWARYAVLCWGQARSARGRYLTASRIGSGTGAVDGQGDGERKVDWP